MGEAQRARRGRAPPLSWPAIVAVAVMHGALVAALAATMHSHRTTPPGAHVTTVDLLASHTAAPATAPAVSLAAARTPQLRAPAIVIASDGARAPVVPPAPAGRIGADAAASHANSLRHYAAQLRAAIAAHKRAGLHRTGSVELRFRLDGAGRLVSLGVARSSGDALLDAAALMAVRAAAPFAPPPPDLAPGDLVFTLPFEFS